MIGLDSFIPTGYQPFNVQALFERYVEMIDILENTTNKIYNDYFELVKFDVTKDTFIPIKYIPCINSLRLFINGVFYSNKCYYIDRNKKIIKWLYIDLNGGFDLDVSDEIELVYDINIDENNINNLTEIE